MFKFETSMKQAAEMTQRWLTCSLLQTGADSHIKKKRTDKKETEIIKIRLKVTDFELGVIAVN